MREMPKPNGGGGELRRVGFPAKNGDRNGDSALITTQGKSLESPCEAPFLAQKSCCEQLFLESTFSQSHDSKSNAHFLSLRALRRKAWQSIQKTAQLLESTFENAAADTQKVDSSVDCRAAATAPARNDTKNATSKKVDSRNTFLSSLQALLHQRSTSTKNINKDSSTTQNVATPQAATRRYSPISTLWRAATSRTKLLLQTIRNATLSALDKCTHSLRRPFIADKDGYCKHCGYRLYKPQWLQELESKHNATTQVKTTTKPKQKDKNEKSNNPKPRSRSREV